MKRHSTSPPCGNLVDGLPHDCVIIRKQWLSPADLGPHNMMNYHPKMIELTRFCSINFKKTFRKPCRAYVEY